MSNLPNKLLTGDVFKPSVVKAINELIDYCKSHELSGDNNTIRINRHASGITISAVTVAVPGKNVNTIPKDIGYNGYFKLILEARPVSNEPGANIDYYVNIVDGATYDAVKDPVSGKSICKVNNITYYIAPYGSNIITETSIFALKYTAVVPADATTGTEYKPAKVEIVNLKSDYGYTELPSDTSEVCWYQLGRVFVSIDGNQNVTITVQQDHQGINGIPQMWWYALCGD